MGHLHLGLKEDFDCESFLVEEFDGLEQLLVVEEEFCLNSFDQPLSCFDF